MFVDTESPDPELLERIEAVKRASVAQLLMKAARLLDEEGVRRARRHFGQPRLRRAHTGLFPHIDMEGTRQTELARRLGVSKQAVAPLVSELVEMGVLVRAPDPEDRRAQRICFADGGAVLLEGMKVLSGLDREMAEVISPPALADMRDHLEVLVTWLSDLPQE